jgi:hypothetical protein
MSSTVPWLYEIFEAETVEVFVNRLDYVVAMVEPGSLLQDLDLAHVSATMLESPTRPREFLRSIKRRSGTQATTSPALLHPNILELRKPVARSNVA